MNKFVTNEVIGHGHTTSSLELNQVGEKMFGNSWDGALGRNEVQKKYNGGVALVNMDKRQYGLPSGTHWVCLVDNHYYDPLLPNGNHWDIEQSDAEQNCGQRCLAFAMLYVMDFQLAKVV